MAVIHCQGSNLMAALCRDAERCSRRSLQITQQCDFCLNQTLLKRLRSEQCMIALRLEQLVKLPDADLLGRVMSLLELTRLLKPE